MIMSNKLSKKTDAWFRELRGPVLKSLASETSRIAKAVGPVPAWAKQSWVRKIGELFEASINKAFNLKNDSCIDPYTLGILSAQLANSSEINFKPSLKAKKIVPRVAIFPGLMNPLQKTLGSLSQRISRVMDKQPWEMRVAFINGYSRGLEKRMYTGQNPIFWENTATRLYALLLLLAPWMHQVKSVNHLHKLLCPRLESIVGRDPKRLEQVCRRIGLKFRERGRPKNGTPV
jgi:hypothetical protein